MPTAQNMRRDAAEAREKARKLLAYAEALEAAADAREGLRSRHGYATVGPMDATAETVKGGRRGPVATEGPMVTAANALGLDSMQALALELDENYDHIRSINSRALRKKGGVPARVQAKIAAKLAEKKAAAKK